jgi:hypothetical protein
MGIVWRQTSTSGDVVIPEISYTDFGEPIHTYRRIRRGSVPSIQKKTQPDKRYPTIGIIQPGRMDDIILCLPIAKWYSGKGYRVIWPVESKVFPLFTYVSYVKAIDLGKGEWRYTAAIGALFKEGIDKIIDLDIGFSRDEENLVDFDLSPQERKYKDAEVPFEERHKLVIEGDLKTILKKLRGSS